MAFSSTSGSYGRLAPGPAVCFGLLSYARAVAPPSRHLLGTPTYVENGLPVILDGGCLVAGCCGVMARVSINERTVVWSNFFARGRPDIPADLKFTFDRDDYERALAEVATLEPEPIPDDD
ncbi:hypothetical protein [Dermatobacter hominis]|uniref:hypothetical protein n=1 Tax=Dermatobacter hominis TaxID=2884263 RepID=UPI001D12A26E|nr:hypothetical protein [Dermatobacter hominis]UDY36081.1 hypothetical protein LH044_00765 [Dermatobacter hominis]